MGLFSGKKNHASKPGSYQVSWPKESGLGQGPYQFEAEAQDTYLVYTSRRRATEPVPLEDMPVMHSANSLLYEMAAGTPVNELPLVQGPIDINWISASVPVPIAGHMLITDRRVIVWYPPMRGTDGQLLMLHHFDLIPRSDIGVSMPFRWGGGMRVSYPFGTPLMAAQMPLIGITFGVHFSSDGHANRRSMSVQATLMHLEAEVRAGNVSQNSPL